MNLFAACSAWLCVLCDSAVNQLCKSNTAEPQRTQRNAEKCQTNSPHSFGGVKLGKEVINFSVLAGYKHQLVFVVGAEGKLSFAALG